MAGPTLPNRDFHEGCLMNTFTLAGSTARRVIQAL